MIQEGMLVTWGSGAPRAVVTMIFNSWVSQGVRVNTDARVKLVEPAYGACGDVYEAGLEVDIPLVELRAVH